MRRDLLELATELARRGEPFALVTVTARKPPVSTHVGDAAVVTHVGDLVGWVGGSCTRATVVAEARKAIEEGRPRSVVLDPDPGQPPRPGVSAFPMTCHSGGSVEIHIQPVLPAPRLLVYGLTPTARALARLGKALGYAVHAVDPQADAQAFPDADTISTDPDGPRLEGAAAPIFAVVATQGQWDEEALRAAAAREPAYLGLVSSARRFAEMRSLLAGQVPDSILSRVRNPAGLDLGARLPEEIALSILAEVVKERRAASEAPPRRAAAAAEKAVDPVCGMAVEMQDARHTTRHGTRDFYFCCAGCRDRFLSAPERYLAAAT